LVEPDPYTENKIEDEMTSISLSLGLTVVRPSLNHTSARAM
jgi:hypothetical protein